MVTGKGSSYRAEGWASRLVTHLVAVSGSGQALTGTEDGQSQAAGCPDQVRTAIDEGYWAIVARQNERFWQPV